MRDENADRACGGIIPPPSRSSFYIVRSRSPLTVNNRRFRAVTSGTRDSRSIPRAYARDEMQAGVDSHRLSLMSQKSHAIEGNSRRTMHARGVAGISGFVRDEDARILQGGAFIVV